MEILAWILTGSDRTSKASASSTFLMVCEISEDSKNTHEKMSISRAGTSNGMDVFKFIIPKGQRETRYLDNGEFSRATPMRGIFSHDQARATTHEALIFKR